MNISCLYKKIFILVLAVILLFVIAVVFTYSFVLPQYSIYSGNLKYRKSLLEAIDTNKIIVVGDSNVGFGISAKLITEEMGIPAVNCGLSRPNGHIFNNNMAFFNVISGDIVLACWSDYYYDDEEINWEALWALLENNFDTYSLFNGCDIPHIIYAFPQFIESAMLRFMLHQNYNGDEYHLNEFGDLDHKISDIDAVFNKDNIYLPKYNDRCINIMNEYNRKLKEKGATLLVVAAPIPNGEFMPEMGGGIIGNIGTV